MAGTRSYLAERAAFAHVSPAEAEAKRRERLERAANMLSFEEADAIRDERPHINPAMVQEVSPADEIQAAQSARDALARRHPTRAMDEEREVQRLAARDPKSGSRGGALARAAVTTGVNLLALPVTAAGKAARALGLPNKAADLDAAEAVADAESLVRGETTAESRERARLGRIAHPISAELGDELGATGAVAAFGGAARAAPAVKRELAAALSTPERGSAEWFRQRRMQRGGVNLSGPTGKAQTTAAPKPPSGRSVRGKAPAPDEQLAYYTDKASTSVMSVDELKSAMRTSAEGYDYSAFNRFARELEKRAEPRGVAEPAPQQPTRAPRVRSDRPLPAFDRRRVQAARTPDMLTRRNARETGAPMASTPAALSAVERLAMRAEKNVRGSYHGDLSDRAREQLTQAREFWEANPEYVAQTNTAAEFLTRHPDVGSIRRMASSSEGFNARLRTEAQRTREYMEHEPRAPWKGARGVVHGGSPKPDVDHQRRRIVDRVLQDALKAGHGYKGTVYRGLNINRETLDSWIESGVVNQKSFWSTSANDKYVAWNAPVRNWDEAVILRLETRNGVPIEGVSPFPHEHELLIPPGRGWRIKNVSRDADGRHIIDAEEIPRQNVPEDAPHSAFSRASDRRVA